MRTTLVAAVGACVLATGMAGSAVAQAELPAPRPGGPAGEAESTAPPPHDPLFDDLFEADLAGADDFADADPFEGTNRNVFRFNRSLEWVLIDPITRGYRFVVPEVARKGIRRAVLNVQSPRTFVNDLLQLRFVDAAETLGRFVLNSTLGVGGLLDPAVEAGWYRHESDFGQTLGRIGISSGPYLMIPVFGPTTVRDGFGSLVDLAFQPLTYVFGPTDVLLQFYINTGAGLTAIDEAHDELEALEDSSIDFYAALRSAYLQNRRAFVRGTDPLGGDVGSAAPGAETARADPVDPEPPAVRGSGPPGSLLPDPRSSR